MSFWKLLDAIAMLSFAVIMTAPRVGQYVVVAEIALIAGLVIGRRIGLRGDR